MESSIRKVGLIHRMYKHTHTRKYHETKKIYRKRKRGRKKIDK